MHLYSPDGAT